MVHKDRIRTKQGNTRSGSGAGIGKKNSMKVNTLKNRVHFDPKNKEHVRDYAYFKKHANWAKGCKYILERPYFNIPAMIENKLIVHFLKRYTEAAK